MLALAIEGITSLTITPLRIIAVSGFAISVISVLQQFTHCSKNSLEIPLKVGLQS
jgi:hypothetical protein